MKKLYALNILLFTILFFAGIHLNEEEKAFIAGLRPQGDNYAWASFAFAAWGFLCALFSVILSYKTINKFRLIAMAYGLFSLGVSICALIILLGFERTSIQESLIVFGPYIVLGMLINFYVYLNWNLDV
ncbi:MAG: hypothetical protein MK207_03770 [Saprospiraceae bacterium]|nr:hypothetical protein [Saprospiraceae bacterium]